MKKLIELEWMKLFRQTKTKVLLIIGWLGALAVAVGNLYLNSLTGFNLVDPDQMPLTAITLLGGLLLPIIVYIISTDTTSGDYSKGTLKFGLMAPCTSAQLYGAKAAVLAIYNGILLAGVLLITLAVNVVMMTENIIINLGTYIIAYVITMIPLFLVSLWGMFFGSRFSSGMSIGLGIISVIGVNVAGVFLPYLSSASPLGYMNLYQMILYGNVSLAAMTSVLLYLAAYYIILITLNLHRLRTIEV